MKDSSPPGATDHAAVTRKAGRGGLLIAAAKVWFLILGLAQNIVLPWLLGAGAFGDLRNALGMASISYNPIVTMSIQGGSRAIANADTADRPAIIRRLLHVHGTASDLFRGVVLPSGSVDRGVAQSAPYRTRRSSTGWRAFLLQPLRSPRRSSQRSTEVFKASRVGHAGRCSSHRRPHWWRLAVAQQWTCSRRRELGLCRGRRHDTPDRAAARWPRQEGQRGVYQHALI